MNRWNRLWPRLLLLFLLLFMMVALIYGLFPAVWMNIITGALLLGLLVFALMRMGNMQGEIEVAKWRSLGWLGQKTGNELKRPRRGSEDVGSEEQKENWTPKSEGLIGMIAGLFSFFILGWPLAAIALFLGWSAYRSHQRFGVPAMGLGVIWFGWFLFLS